LSKIINLMNIYY